jgi:hypothetical protein
MCNQLARVWPVDVADLLVGIIVDDDERGLRFVAVDRRFRVLDGSSFRRLGDARQAASRVARTTAPIDEEVWWSRAA